MDDAGFEAAAEELLQRLADRLENADSDLDVEFQRGVLAIDLPDGGQFLLNKHAPTHQIWLSSPRSGARHFADDGHGGWRDTRDGRDLMGVLAEDFAAVGVTLTPG
jgi:iron-sulfur cluster assembly protein CyaY